MVSAIILCKNEENNIINCIKSVSFCDEIIVVDDFSTDKTIDLIKKTKNTKIKIFEYRLNEDFSKSRNFGLSKVKGDWTFFIDADEIVSPSLAFEISNAVIFSSSYNAFYIRRYDNLWGKKLKYGEVGGIELIRLSKKDTGVWQGKVHEELKIQGKVGILKNPLIHYPHKTLTEFLGEINWYSSLRAEELFKKKAKAHWWSILVYPLGKLFKGYFLKKGFLDGNRGLIVAIIMSFHSFLVRGKLWQLTLRNE